MANRCKITLPRVFALISTFVLGLLLTVFWNATNATVKDYRSSSRRVLLDMRQRIERQALSNEEFRAGGEELVAVNERILPEVFPNGYLARGFSDCAAVSTKKMADDSRELEWARSHGYFRPRVYTGRGGSFTEPHVGEALYQIDVGECNAQSGPLAFGSTQLAVFRGRAVRASVNTILGGEFYSIGDVDDDGVDELLLGRDNHDDSGGFMRLSLVSLKGGNFRLLHDFGNVGAHYKWDNLTNDYAIDVAVLSYLPKDDEHPLVMYSDIYRGHCKIKDEQTRFPNPDNCWPNHNSWMIVPGSNN